MKLPKSLERKVCQLAGVEPPKRSAPPVETDAPARLAIEVDVPIRTRLKPAELVAMRVMDWCRERGFRPPTVEYRFAAQIGRKWAFDLAWPDHKVAVELQGGNWTGGRHTRGQGFENDCEKFSTAAVMGWRVLMATYRQCNKGQLLSWLEAIMSDTIGDGERQLAVP